jgi:hypothetical protein
MDDERNRSAALAFPPLDECKEVIARIHTRRKKDGYGNSN